MSEELEEEADEERKVSMKWRGIFVQNILTGLELEKEAVVVASPQVGLLLINID